jgi:SAM-dependent methyltransferase
MKPAARAAGDFTGLAADYSRHRPDYCPAVLSALLGLLERPAARLDVVDVGAGTGIWTRMLAARGVRSATAVEPNDDMRAHGMADCAGAAGTAIAWVKGDGARSGLPPQCCDWLTMASSFHWVDFDAGTRECHRLLRPGGRFTALWNPRQIELQPLLLEIEAQLATLRPDLQRVSSGRSGMTATLTERLCASPYFDDVVYLEGRHVVSMSAERYLGAWRSVNDLRVQLGAEKFAAFLAFVERRIAGLDRIEASYLTRAWSARRREPAA